MSKIVVHTEPKRRVHGLSVEVHGRTTVALTAEDARHRVNREVIPELDTELGAGAPDSGDDQERLINHARWLYTDASLSAN